MIRVVGYDIAREGSDNTAIQFRVADTTPPDLSRVGEEFQLTKWELKRHGLPSDTKLIVTSVFERDGIPYMTAFVV